MYALREIRNIKSNRLIINLPADFKKDTRVEIIILPVNNNITDNAKKNRFGVGKYNFKGGLDSYHLRDFAYAD